MIYDENHPLKDKSNGSKTKTKLNGLRKIAL